MTREALTNRLVEVLPVSVLEANMLSARPPLSKLRMTSPSEQAIVVLRSQLTARLRRRRGLLVAWSTNVAIISGFVGSALVVLVVLAAYGGRPSDGVWRISFGVGCVVSWS